jgi:hypothetical protein
MMTGFLFKVSPDVVVDFDLVCTCFLILLYMFEFYGTTIVFEISNS